MHEYDDYHHLKVAEAHRAEVAYSRLKRYDVVESFWLKPFLHDTFPPM